ncbi:MAG: hypothetical protein ACI9XO_002955 [Paraglaciecola sp.]|jgi:hypothetical protein
MKYSYLLLFILFFSCQNGNNTSNEKRNIRDFYFPIDQLFEGKVYEYQSVGNEHDPPFYWYYRTLNTGENVYFTGMYYDYNFTPFQFIREEEMSNGMSLQDFYWYETDSLTNTQNKVDVNISSSNVFPFQVSNPPGVVVSSINWKLPTDSLTTMTFIRNRQFNRDTLVEFQNRKVDAIQMNVLELIDNEREGHLEQEYSATEIYGKGIGLIYFEKNIASEWKMKYKLVDIYSMDEFLEKSGVQLTEEK